MYRVVCLAILLVAALTITATAQQNTSVQEWYNNGKSAFDAEKYDIAIDAFTKVIEQRSDEARPRVMRAYAYMQQGAFAQALGDLDTVIAWYKADSKRVEPDDITQAYFLRGEISIGTRGVEAAIRDFDAVLKLEPNTPRAYFKRGFLKIAVPDSKGAMDDLAVYIKTEDRKGKYRHDVARALILRAAQYTIQEEYQAAVTDYNSAIDLGIDSTIVYFLRGVAKLNMRDSAGAIADMSTYISAERKVSPTGANLATALIARANLYMSANNYDKVVDDIDGVIAISPLLEPAQLAVLHTLKGNALKAMDRNEEAMAEYTNALRLNADFVSVLMSRGYLYLTTNRASAAKPDFTKVINLLGKEPNSLSTDSLQLLAAALYGRAIILREEGELSAALQDLEKAAVYEAKLSGTTDLGIWQAMGDVKLELKDYPGALAAFNEALKKQSDNSAGIYYNRARVYYSTGDTLAAIADITKAIEKEPNESAFYFMRGNLHSDMSNYDEAIEDYTKAIRYNDKEPAYYINRAIAAINAENTSTVCDDLKKAVGLGLQEAKKIYDDLIKEGLCK